MNTLPGAHVHITSITGQTFYQGKSNNNGELILYTKDFPSGIYIITIRKDDRMISLKGMKIF